MAKGKLNTSVKGLPGKVIANKGVSIISKIKKSTGTPLRWAGMADGTYPKRWKIYRKRRPVDASFW
jgi:hypothetical protein